MGGGLPPVSSRVFLLARCALPTHTLSRLLRKGLRAVYQNGLKKSKSSVQTAEVRKEEQDPNKFTKGNFTGLF